MKRLPVVAAVAALAASAAQGAGATHRVDLATGRVDGKAVIGMTAAQATVVFGRPDFRVTGAVGRIGWGARSDFSLELLVKKGRVWSVVFERGVVRDAQAGDLLAKGAAARVRSSRGYRTERPHRCRSSVCTTVLVRGPLHLTLGSTPGRGAFVTLWRP